MSVKEYILGKIHVDIMGLISGFGSMFNIGKYFNVLHVFWLLVSCLLS